MNVGIDFSGSPKDERIEKTKLPHCIKGESSTYLSCLSLNLGRQQRQNSCRQTELFSVMRWGRLGAAKATSSGSGWHSMSKREKLSECRSAIGVETAPKDYGRRCQQYIDNAQLLTLILGLLMRRSFPVSDITVWVKTVARPVILSDLTALCEARVSRLVRKTLSFSKKLENPSGAIWDFVYHYNASLPV